MEGLKRWRPTPSFVVSCMALFVALSGSAIALQGQNSVRSDDLASGAVHRGDIAKNAVNSAKVANGTLRNADFAPGTLLQGPQGPPGPPGPSGGGGGAPSGPAGGALAGTYPNPTLATNAVPANGPAGTAEGSTKVASNAIAFNEIRNGAVRASLLAPTVIRTSTFTVAGNNFNQGTQGCAAGERLLSGGGISSSSFTYLVDSAPASITTWRVTVRQTSPNPATITVYALCLTAA